MPRKLKNSSYQKKLHSFIVEDVVSTATDLFVKKGYDSITMAEIAERVNISKGSLYNYVGPKENLINLIADSLVNRYAAAFSKIDDSSAGLSSVVILDKYIKAYLEIVDELQDAHIFILHIIVRLSKEGRRRLLAYSVKMQDYIERVLIQGVETGEFMMENTKLMAIIIGSLLSSWASQRWQLRSTMTLEGYREQVTPFIMKAVGARTESRITV